jgi:hypothetical protein
MSNETNLYLKVIAGTKKRDFTVLTERNLEINNITTEVLTCGQHPDIVKTELAEHVE